MKKDLLSLVANNNTEQALEELLQSTANLPLNSEIVVLSGQFKNLQLKERSLQLTDDQVRAERTRINAALTGIINELPNEVIPLTLWIVSTTRDKIPEDLKLKQKVLALHHETDAAQWKPFYDEPPICELLETYKDKVNFKVVARFLGTQPLTEEELNHWLTRLDKVVLVLDGFAMDDKESLSAVRRFNKHEIGGCLVPICPSYSFAAFQHIRSNVQEHLGDLYRLFADFTNKYLHFIFPIPTKDLFFRTLTNLALVHLSVTSIIADEKDKSKAQVIRSQSFTF